MSTYTFKKAGIFDLHLFNNVARINEEKKSGKVGSKGLEQIGRIIQMFPISFFTRIAGHTAPLKDPFPSFTFLVLILKLFIFSFFH